jgi:SAM-dependent methyltransferase
MPVRGLARLRRLSPFDSRGADGGLSAPDCCAWLERLHGERLGRIEAACADASPERFALFRDLPADAWALLLTRCCEGYPNIGALLPDVPEPALQEHYNGRSGIPLARQSVAFYTQLVTRFEQHLDGPIEDARVLDFGCGWGRLTRFLARDVRPGRLYGCDPVEQILEVCRTTRVPARLARSDFLPERLPFEESFDLAFSFSVFTHLSERAHLSCLHALRDGLRPGGILVVTVRPPEYLELSELMRPALDSLGPGWKEALREPRHLFVPHAADPGHHQYGGGEMHFGEAVITMPYVEQRWAPLFELLDVDLPAEDPYQVMLTMRRR